MPAARLPDVDGDSPSGSVIIAPLFPRVLVGAISGVLAVVLGYDMIVNGVTPVGIAGAVLGVFGVYAMIRLRVTLSDETITVRNVLRTHRLRPEEVRLIDSSVATMWPLQGALAQWPVTRLRLDGGSSIYMLATSFYNQKLVSKLRRFARRHDIPVQTNYEPRGRDRNRPPPAPHEDSDEPRIW